MKLKQGENLVNKKKSSKSNSNNGGDGTKTQNSTPFIHRRVPKLAGVTKTDLL